jgi:hypothetical protein
VAKGDCMSGSCVVRSPLHVQHHARMANTRSLILLIPSDENASQHGSDIASLRGSVSTVKGADAQAQAAALLRGAHVTPPAHLTELDASERVVADVHRQAAAMRFGQAGRSARSIEQNEPRIAAWRK